MRPTRRKEGATYAAIVQATATTPEGDYLAGKARVRAHAHLFLVVGAGAAYGDRRVASAWPGSRTLLQIDGLPIARALLRQIERVHPDLLWARTTEAIDFGDGKTSYLAIGLVSRSPVAILAPFTPSPP